MLSAEVFRPIPILSCYVYRTFSLDVSHHLCNGILRRHLYEHMHVVYHHMPFQYPAFTAGCQPPYLLPQIHPVWIHTAFSVCILVSTRYDTCTPTSNDLNCRNRTYFPPLCNFEPAAQRPAAVHTLEYMSDLYIPATVKLFQTASRSWRFSLAIKVFPSVNV